VHYREKVSDQWNVLLQRCRQLLQEEEQLREVSEIVGAEGLQDTDRLLMSVAERLRTEVLQQNAYSEDAFSPPDKTFGIVKRILDYFDRAVEMLKQGTSLEEVLKGE
jgi:V/A-type H+-transporting ATPase subunit A